MEQHRRKQHSLMMLVRLRSPLCALSDPILSGVVVVVVGGGGYNMASGAADIVNESDCFLK